MALGDYFAVNDYDRTQWVVFGGHAVVAMLFLAGAVRVLNSGGDPTGAVLFGSMAVLVLGLGLTVARIVGRRK
jgi:hypothetical protein